MLLFSALVFAVSASAKGMDNVSDIQHFDSLKVKSQELINTPGEIVYLDSMLHLAESMDSVYWQCRTMSFMARNYYNRMKADSLMYWADKVAEQALENEFYSIYFDTYSLVCSWELYEKDYDSALDKANHLYLFAKELDDADGMIASYETIGLIYMETFRFVEAIKSYKEGLALQKKQKNPRYAYQFQFMSYIVEAYLKLKDYKEAEEALTEAYALVEQCKANEPNFPADRCLWLLDCYNIELNVLQKNHKEAEKYVQASQKYEKIDDFYVFCYYHLVLASYYQLEGNYNQALQNVEMVLSETGDDYLPALKIKAELLLKAGKEQEAAQLYHKSVNLIDSTYNESMSKQINQLRTIHEVDKLELKNKQMELEAGRYKLTITLVLLIVLLVALIVVFVHYVYLKRMKSLLERSDEELKKDKEQLLVSERALSLAKEKAEADNRFKDVYLANLSQEIRTPLNSIVGFSSLLGDMYDKEDAKEYVSIIKNSSDLLLKLVNDTVCLSLLQTDQTPFVLENIEINQYCRSVLREFESKLPPAVCLQYQSSVDRFILQTDTTRLKQVFEILLTTAVKYAEEGEVDFIFKVYQEKEMVQFVVESKGSAVPEEMQERICKSFEKSEASTQGIELGLTICRIIINRLEGDITLDTSYTEGIRIVLTHPIQNNNN